MNRDTYAGLIACLYSKAWLTLAACGLLATVATAQEPATPKGIPVTSELVVAKCGTCHAKDADGNLSRISYVRATPEGWEEAIKRMVRLNGLRVTPEEARAILKYLATDHGLAPEEARSVMYFAEHRIVDEPAPNETVRGTCMGCHAVGKALSWRRTRDDWQLLANFHIASFAQAEAAYRRGGGRGGNAKGGKLPIDNTLDFLGKEYGLESPEWSAWKARMRTPKLAGRWALSGHVTGKGELYGEMEMMPGPTPEEFTTKITLHSVEDGSTVEKTGRGLVYGGYSWRGRSSSAMPATEPDSLDSEMREVLWFSPDQTWAEGRWFWGEYQEFGVDVKLMRIDANPILSTVDGSSLKAGAEMQRVRLLGKNLPADLAADDLDLGPGITVASLVSHTPEEVVVMVDVDAAAVPGKRDVVLGDSVLPSALSVYDHIDYLKVLPESTLSRLGSEVHPKGYMQFEAVGYHRGADGKPNTADDVELGAVDVDWSMQEFLSVYGDDDKEFVGSLSNTGLFVPASDGPNPARKFSRNNYGDVWIVGTAKDETGRDGKPLIGKSYLVVTVPTYIRWDQPEVAP